jgi:hypothetical protein
MMESLCLMMYARVQSQEGNINHERTDPDEDDEGEDRQDGKEMAAKLIGNRHPFAPGDMRGNADRSLGHNLKDLSSRQKAGLLLQWLIHRLHPTVVAPRPHNHHRHEENDETVLFKHS